jgi:D-arabinose 1-dehydrogenase-like Zn-dependent alcohol dehydrogenase
LKNWDESQRPGVYFLLERHSTDHKNTVYIGESENVFRRLIEHDRKKDFWNEVIIFTSKDENLTKSHIKYLEARLTDLTIKAEKEDPLKVIKKFTDGKMADVIIEATGKPSVVDTCLKCLSKNGRLSLAGIFHQKASIDLAPIVRREYHIFGSIYVIAKLSIIYI